MQVAKTKPRAYCDNITVTTAEGKQYNLGSPSSKLFKLRLKIYKLRRKIKNG